MKDVVEDPLGPTRLPPAEMNAHIPGEIELN